MRILEGARIQGSHDVTEDSTSYLPTVLSLARGFPPHGGGWLLHRRQEEGE